MLCTLPKITDHRPFGFLGICVRLTNPSADCHSLPHYLTSSFATILITMATRGRQVQYSPGGRLIFTLFLYPTIQLLQFSLVDNWSWNDPFWVQEGQRDAHFIIRVCMQQVTQYVCTCVECILQADSRNCCASLVSTSVLEYIWAPSLSVIQCLGDGIKLAGLSFSAVLYSAVKLRL